MKAVCASHFMALAALCVVAVLAPVLALCLALGSFVVSAFLELE